MTQVQAPGVRTAADTPFELPARVSLAHRIGMLLAVGVPPLGLLAAIIGMWGWGFTWVELVLFISMYAATGLGVTVGFHRLLTHRSFETYRPVKFALAVLGSMTLQGPVLNWVAVHRRHHQHSDGIDDPHSPNLSGGGLWGTIAGWWHAHIGWMFRTDLSNLTEYVRDFRSDRMVQFVHRHFGAWVALGLLIPTVLGGVISGTWTGALLGFLWGGLVRIFFGHHATFSINSICHMWGGRPFRAHDNSRNNFLCGVLALGEGWHNNHHAFPTSARHGLAWWQIDLSYVFIRTLAWTRLAWRVRVPGREAMDAKRAVPG